MYINPPTPLFPLGPCSVYGAVWERGGSAGVSQGAGGPVWTADPGPRGGEEESGPPCHQPLGLGPPYPPHAGNTPHLNPSNPHPALKGIYCMPSTQHPNWIIPSIHHSSLLWLHLFSTSARPTCVPVYLFASSLNVFVDSFSKTVSWNRHPLTHRSFVFSLLTVGLKWQKCLKADSKFMVGATDRNKSSWSTLQHCQQPHCRPPVAVLSHLIKSTRASASHCCRETARNPAAHNRSKIIIFFKVQ